MIVPTLKICCFCQVNVWNGSLEIGVTTLDPEIMELPATATKLRNTAWVRLLLPNIGFLDSRNDVKSIEFRLGQIF